MNRNMEKYYAHRAAELDWIYNKTERQADLAELKAALSNSFKGLKVLEIACGTGYWTQYLARSAHAILAADYNSEMVFFAAKRDYMKCPVSLKIADAYDMPEIETGFEAGFAGFFWSHVPLSRRTELIRSFHSHLAGEAKVVWIDNVYVEGSSTPINRRGQSGDCYQIRTLSDNSQYEVIKNYPTEKELIDAFTPYANNISVKLFQYYWLLSYTVNSNC